MPAPSRLNAYINNDQMIEVDNVFGVVTNTSYNAASVTATLVDSGNLLGQGSQYDVFTVTLSYTQQAGTYRGKVTAAQTANLPAGSYTLAIAVTDSVSGNSANITLPINFAVRNS